MIRLGSLTIAPGAGRPMAAWKLCTRDRIRVEGKAYTGEGTVLHIEQDGLKLIIHWAGEDNVSGCWVVHPSHEVYVIRGSLLWLR